MILTGLFSNKKTRFLRDLMSMFVAQVVVKVVGFASFAFLARKLSQDSYGAIEVIISFTGLVLLLVDFGLGQIGVRELKLSKSDPDIVHEIPTLRFLIAMICLPFFLVFAHFHFHNPLHETVVFFFAVTVLLVAWKQEWFLQASEKIQNIGIGQTLRTLTFAVSVIFLVRDGDDVIWVGVGEVISVSAWIAYLLYLQVQAGFPPRFVLRRERATKLLRDAAPLGLSSISWGGVQYLPPIIVAVFAGLNEAALLAVAQRIVTSLQSLGYIYHFTLYTALIERYRQSVEALQKLVHASNRIVAWATIGPAMVCAVHANDLMAGIFGDPYRSAGLAFALLIFTIPLQLLSGHERWTLTTIGKTGSVFQANLFGTIVAVLGCLAAVPFFGATGAAGAGLAASISVWSVATYLCRRHGVPLKMAIGVLRPVVVAAAANVGMSMAGDFSSGFQSLGAILIYFAVIPLVDRKFLTDLRHVAYAKKHLAKDD